MDTPFIKILVNSILILITIGVADYFIFRDRIVEKVINYDRPELLAESKQDELEADLKTRFGITGISGIQAGNIDTAKEKVRLKVQIRDRDHKHFREN